MVGWVKLIWKLCRDMGVTLVPRWQRRNELMMQRVDALSKTGTLWQLRPSWAQQMFRDYGIYPLLPDLSRCGPTVKAAVSRTGTRAVLVLPRWEGKTWWALAVRCCSSYFGIKNII